MQADVFILVLATGILVILISMVLDFVWARILPGNAALFLLQAPGVVVHECSHIFGCLLTGAKIRNVVLLSRKGGSVTYSAPVIPLLGNVIISAAPLICVPLILAGCTWFFMSYLGCIFPVLPQELTSQDSFLSLGGGIAGMFLQNILIRFNPWFFLYLYLTLSLVLSLAPSGRDVKNAAAGIFCLAIVCGFVYSSGLLPAIAILDEICRLLDTAFVLGLGCDLIALVISIPVIIGFLHGRRGLV